MATPVTTNKWAGQFDCSVCRRKRLMASEFSRKALEQHRATGGALKCKQCTTQQQQAEQEAAKARRAADAKAAAVEQDDDDDKEQERLCASCQKQLGFSAYNRNQWNKGEGKSRCRDCVDKAVAEEAAKSKMNKQEAIEKAKQDLVRAKASGSSQVILKAESVLSALEAEKVTGLKPVKMGRGRDRFGRGSHGRGRGARKNV